MTFGKQIAALAVVVSLGSVLGLAPAYAAGTVTTSSLVTNTQSNQDTSHGRDRGRGGTHTSNGHQQTAHYPRKR